MTSRIGGMRSSLGMKAPARCATTTNISLTGFQTVDGVTLAVTDENLRVLVKNQTDTTENGIYDAKARAWTRAKDFDGADDIVSGTSVLVGSGNTYANTWFRVSSDDPLTIGTSSIAFSTLEMTPLAATESVAGRVRLATQTETYVGTDDATAVTPLKLATKLPVMFATSFGVLTSNSAATNTANMNAAISAINTLGGKLLLPQGTIPVLALDPVTGNGASIEGQGMYYGGSVLSFGNATGTCITLSAANHCHIRNVHITASVRRTADFAIKVTGSCFMPMIQNVRIDYHYNGIWMHTGTQAIIDHVHCRYMLGTKDLYTGGISGNLFGLKVSGFSVDNPYPTGEFGTVQTWSTGLVVTANDIVNVNSKIYQCSQSGTTSGSGTGPSGIPGTGTSDAFSTEITDGTAKWKFVCDAQLVSAYVDSFSYSVGFTDTQLIGGNIGIVVDDTVASGTSYPLWIDTSQVDVDHSYSMNVSLLGGESYTALDDWYGSSLQSYGVYIGPSFRGEVTICAGTRISGCWLDGAYLSSGPVNTNIDNCKIYINSAFGASQASGIKVAAGASYFKITNNTIGKGPLGTGLQKYGIEVAVGASDHYVICNNMLHGNATSALSDGGSGTDKRVHHNPPAFDPISYVGDASFSFSLSASNPVIGFDATDYLTYDRTGNTLSTVIGGAVVHQIGATSTYVPSLELGHASDTTLTRSAAGLPAVDGVTIALNSTSRAHTAQSIAIGDANFSASLSASNPVIGLDANDYQLYDRTSNVLSTVIGATTVFSQSASRNTSAVPISLPSYTVAGLPAGAAADLAYASNGRKNGEGAGLGTGVVVFKDGTAWRAVDTGATVAA